MMVQCYQTSNETYEENCPITDFSFNQGSDRLDIHARGYKGKGVEPRLFYTKNSTSTPIVDVRLSPSQPCKDMVSYPGIEDYDVDELFYYNEMRLSGSNCLLGSDERFNLRAYNGRLTFPGDIAGITYYNLLSNNTVL